MFFSIYDDYEITYQSQIDQNLIFIIILSVILIAILITFIVAMVKIYKKANRSGISALIPFYNAIVLLEITNQSKWKFLPHIIPIINIPFILYSFYRIAKSFRKSKSFCWLTSFLSLIYIPILGFGSSEYMGINEEAMTGVSVAKELPVVPEKQTNSSLPEQPAKERTKVNMSIGGGVYQKEYVNSLTQVQNEQSSTITDTENQNSNLINFDQNKEMYQSINMPELKQPETNTMPMNLLSSATNTELSVIPIVEKKETENTFINNGSLIEEKPLNNNIDSNSLSFLAPINEQTPTNQIDQQPSIFAPIEAEQVKPDTSSNSLSFQIDPTIQGLDDNSLKETAEFISCPKCGAKVKNGSIKCFMCGKEL